MRIPHQGIGEGIVRPSRHLASGRSQKPPAGTRRDRAHADDQGSADM